MGRAAMGLGCDLAIAELYAQILTGLDLRRAAQGYALMAAHQGIAPLQDRFVGERAQELAAAGEVGAALLDDAPKITAQFNAMTSEDTCLLGQIAPQGHGRQTARSALEITAMQQRVLDQCRAKPSRDVVETLARQSENVVRARQGARRGAYAGTPFRHQPPEATVVTRRERGDLAHKIRA